MPTVDGARLLGDLRELRTFGAATTHPLGVVRPSYSEADMASRLWLKERFEEAGLETVIDGVGAAVKQAEALTALNLKTSKRGAYAFPAAKIFTGPLASFAPEAGKAIA